MFQYEKRERNVRKIKKASPTLANSSILHYALAKNVSWLRVFLRFGTFEVTKTEIQRIV